MNGFLAYFQKNSIVLIILELYLTIKVTTLCLVTPLGEKGDPVYFHPVGARTGHITEYTLVEDLIIQPLTFNTLNSEAAAEWLPRVENRPLEERNSRVQRGLQAHATVQSLWKGILFLLQEIQKAQKILRNETAILSACYSEKALAQSERHIWYELSGGDTIADAWELAQREANRNARLGSQYNTIEKLTELRKKELLKKIGTLIGERERYKATLLLPMQSLQQEIATIEKERTAFRKYVRYIIEILINDPGPLAEQRTQKESDVRAQLLKLPPRQALVRLVDGIDRRPKTHLMQTPDLPAGVRKDEVRRRRSLVQEQTRPKYQQPRSKVEQELRDAPIVYGSEERSDDMPHDLWYEE